MNEKIQSISPLVDQFSRTISYLRLSLTDRCNLRCVYCMPQDTPDNVTHVKTGKFLAHSDLLSYEELLRVVSLAATLGMTKIRLTGGEPLVRKGVIDFIHNLSQVQGLEQIRLTTNGVLLERFAENLYEEGVRNLNISLDTLRPERFKKITGKDCFEDVRRGILLAKEIGFKLKINAVAMRGVNDDEFADFAQMAIDHGIQVRFIEFMPVGEQSSWQKDQFIDSSEIRERIEALGQLTPIEKSHGDGPARLYNIVSDTGKKGSVGFISPISHHFCDKCNRLRLTSEGRLRACLLKDSETDLKALLRSGASDLQIVETIRNAILNKPQGHTLEHDLGKREEGGCSTKMSRIGG